MKLNAYYSQSKLIFSSREALAFSFNKKNGQWATVVHLTDTNDEFLPDDNTPHYLKTLDNSVLGETTLNFNWFNDIGELDVLSPETETGLDNPPKVPFIGAQDIYTGEFFGVIPLETVRQNKAFDHTLTETEMVEIKNVSHNTSKISNKTVIDLDGLISKTIDAIRSQVLQDI
jgi:hypothetical protein